jgi:hypothetical protein
MCQVCDKREQFVRADRLRNMRLKARQQRAITIPRLPERGDCRRREPPAPAPLEFTYTFD